MKYPKFPKVKEYADALFVNGKEIPYILLNTDGSTTTKVKGEGDRVKVTITFLAKSYHYDPSKWKYPRLYKFKTAHWYNRFWDKLKHKL